MTGLLVIVDDRIRDERIRVALDPDVAISVLVDNLVKELGLPRRDFALQTISYQLIRALDGRAFHPDVTLRGASVHEGELLELVSPEGRRVWETVRRLLDEIEKTIRDEIKDRITEEVWNRVTKKLAEIEKTLTGGDRVERVRQWVAQHGGPGQLLSVAESLASQSHAQTYSASTNSPGGVVRPTSRPRIGLWLLIIGGGLVTVILGGLILLLLFWDFEPPEPPIVPIDPIEPIEPIDPFEPIEPIGPLEPIDPIDPIEPPG